MAQPKFNKEGKTLKLKVNMVFGGKDGSFPAGSYKGEDIPDCLVREFQSGSPHVVDMTPVKPAVVKEEPVEPVVKEEPVEIKKKATARKAAATKKANAALRASK